MIYASSKDRFKRELDGIQVEFQANNLLKWALMLLEAALYELCNGDLSNYWFNVYRSWNLELALIYDNGLVFFTFKTS